MKLGLRQGQPYVALIYVLGIIMIAFVMVVLFNPLKITYELGASHEASQDADLQNFFVQTRTILFWLPLMLILPVTIWVIIKINEKQEMY